MVMALSSLVGIKPDEPARAGGRILEPDAI